MDAKSTILLVYSFVYTSTDRIKDIMYMAITVILVLLPVLLFTSHIHWPPKYILRVSTLMNESSLVMFNLQFCPIALRT